LFHSNIFTFKESPINSYFMQNMAYHSFVMQKERRSHIEGNSASLKSRQLTKIGNTPL
jgi:hypothetical protein